MTARRVVVLGPTGSGKSDVAMAAARQAGGAHIVACDSMQVYRGMDIGTGKPTASDRAEVTHHGLDLCGPDERFTVSRYAEEIDAARGRIAVASAHEIIVGGTGLYLTAVTDGLSVPGEWPAIRAELEANPDTAGMYARLGVLDPVAASRIEPNNRRRIVRALEVCLGSGRRFSDSGDGVAGFPDDGVVRIGIRWERDALRARIASRVAGMVADGLVDEVRGLLASPGLSATAAQALGYKEMVDHVEGRASLTDAVAETVLRTQQFAVRQERWFRRDPRVRWVDVTSDPVREVTPLVLEALS
ncbi:MAG: tRNA delta(2)-isopentenylpyrophosphate transferase [Actinomycetota bacterium]